MDCKVLEALDCSFVINVWISLWAPVCTLYSVGTVQELQVNCTIRVRDILYSADIDMYDVPCRAVLSITGPAGPNGLFGGLCWALLYGPFKLWLLICLTGWLYAYTCTLYSKMSLCTSKVSKGVHLYTAFLHVHCTQYSEVSTYTTYSTVTVQGYSVLMQVFMHNCRCSYIYSSTLQLFKL